MAHEFNNCLTIIRLKSDKLGRSIQPGRAEKWDADIIHETARRGSDVVATLLALSHDHAETPTLVEIDTLLDQNQSYFQTLIGPAATIVLDLGAAQTKVRVSRSKVLLAISHILMGMGPSTSEGTTVHLKTRADPCGSGQSARLNLAITNSGIGKPPHDVELLICPLLSGPISILELATKEEWNGKEAQAGGDHRQAA